MGLSAQIQPAGRSLGPAGMTSLALADGPTLLAAAGVMALRVVPGVGSESPLTLSKPLAVDLIVYRGDTGLFRITVANADGSPHPVTDATWDADIRVSPDDTTVITTMIVSPTPSDTAAVDVTLTAAQSRLINQSAVYDVEMTQGGIVTTLIAGRVVLTKDVSRA